MRKATNNLTSLVRRRHRKELVLSKTKVEVFGRMGKRLWLFTAPYIGQSSVWCNVLILEEPGIDENKAKKYLQVIRELAS
jgi:hypothetical protein